MALKGNGYYMFDELTMCSSPLNYQTSTASWHSGISNYGMKMSHPPSQTTTTATVVSCEGAIPRPVKSCYGLDELLPFSPHSLDNTNRGNPLQNGKLASEQSALTNLFGPRREHQSKCNVSAEDSSGSEHSTEDPQSKKCARKRKILPRDKARGDPCLNPCLGENTEKESEGKRPKIGEGTNEKPDLKSEVEQNSKDCQQSVKPPEPPKDYIHVRARRGQATDSHSLAERVRREKISERMKLLQDLVPGCNKITGKAVMLDEIINYVQSLQHQVEFLSMKLEAVNPRLDFNTEEFLTKDMHEPSSIAFTSNTAIAYPQFPQPEWAHMQLGMSRNIEEPSMGNNRELAVKSMMNGHISPAESCGDPIPQMPNGWDNELQSVVQLGFGQNIQPSFTAQSFQGPFSTSYTNIEH